MYMNMYLLTRHKSLKKNYINICDKVIWTSHDADVMATYFKGKQLTLLKQLLKLVSKTTFKYITEK